MSISAQQVLEAAQDIHRSGLMTFGAFGTEDNDKMQIVVRRNTMAKLEGLQILLTVLLVDGTLTTEEHDEVNDIVHKEWANVLNWKL